MRRRADYRRALPISLLVSLGVHTVVFHLWVDVDLPVAGNRSAETGEAWIPGGMRVLNLDAAPERSNTPRVEQPHEERPAPSREVQGEPHQPAGVEPGRVYDPAAALRPRLDDPRLWSPIPPAPADPISPESGRLRSRTDSIAGTQSPGVTLRVLGIPLALCSGGTDPADCGFGILPWRREEYRLNQDLKCGLKRQGAWADLLDRARSIRVRHDSLRDTLPSP